MYAQAFTAHRVKRWRIGSNEVLRNIKRENLLSFFETLYRPENIIVSIAGDVTAKEALDAVTPTFGAIPGSYSPRLSRSSASESCTTQGKRALHRIISCCPQAKSVPSKTAQLGSSRDYTLAWSIARITRVSSMYTIIFG